jgi:acid phosphatase type 7
MTNQGKTVRHEAPALTVCRWAVDFALQENRMARARRTLFPGRWSALPLAGFLALTLSGCVVDIDIAKHGRIPVISGDGVTVYAAGDIADCRKFPPAATGAARTAKLLQAELEKNENAAVLTLGDHTYPNGRLVEFTDCYAPTWGRFKSRTYPAPGNHEYYTRGATGYYDYFGAAAGPGRRGYYSFTLGNWHIVSLNSNLKQPMEHDAQLEWLKNELAQNKSLCTLAYWHHPVYSSGGHGDNPKMQDAWRILFEAGADVVLVSHDHNYERFAPLDGHGRLNRLRGMRQFVVGTGGATLTPFRFRRPNSEGGSNSVHGVLKLVLKESGYEWEFLPVEPDGFTDRGASLCH